MAQWLEPLVFDIEPRRKTYLPLYNYRICFYSSLFYQIPLYLPRDELQNLCKNPGISQIIVEMCLISCGDMNILLKIKLGFDEKRFQILNSMMTTKDIRSRRHFQIPSPMNADAGFTLLEILLAITIFGIVMAMVLGAYHTVLSTAEAVRDGSGSYEVAKTCMNRMMTDLQAIRISMVPEYTKPGLTDPPNPYRIVGDTSYAGDGVFSRLRFTSYEHLPFENDSKEGVAEIVYYVQEAEDDRHVLRRADHLYPYEEFEEDPSDPALCDNVKSLAFVFYDHEGTEYEKWDSEDEEFEHATPAAIKIKLEIGDDSSSIPFETMVYFKIFRDSKR